MSGKEEELSPVVMEPDSKTVGSEAMVGCGLKRKAEDAKEAPAVDVVVVGLPESEQLVRFRLEPEEEDMVYEDDSDEFDSDEDSEIIFAKIKAKFEARCRESEARYEYSSVEEDSHGDDKEVV